MMTTSQERRPERALHGRRRSHKLRKTRASLFETLGPELALPGLGPFAQDAPLAREGGQTPPLDLGALFPGARAVWLEIGFGGGEHLAAQAAANPDVGFIGCEHYRDGVGKLFSTIERDGLRNVRVHAHDARDVMDAAPDGAFDRVFLLYPDPWPKKRHHKRRFVSQENFDSFARVMAPGAALRVASDIPDYIRQALQVGLGHPAFDWTARQADDWRRPWADWPGTRYEAKALAEGRTPCYLTFRRR